MNEEYGQRKHDNDFHRRANDHIVPRIEQKLDDLIVEFRTHRNWGETISKIHDERISNMERLLDKINWPAKAVGWLIITGATGTLLWVGERFGCWIAKHFNGG